MEGRGSAKGESAAAVRRRSGRGEDGDGPCNWKSFGLTILQDSAKMLAKRGLAEQ